MKTDESGTMNESTTAEPEAMWAYIEVMGHQCAAGRVTDVRIGSVTMLRVEPPGGRVQIINPTSIFRMTPCTEDEARALAHRSTETIARWMLEPRTAGVLPAAVEPDDVDFEEEERAEVEW